MTEIEQVTQILFLYKCVQREAGQAAVSAFYKKLIMYDIR